MASEISQWLEKLDLSKYTDVFAENEIDLDAARHLSDDDLKELGLPMGPRRRVLAAIEQLPMPAVNRALADAASGSIDTRQTSAQRRQLTVMFSDLVGSTELSRKLDPEDLRDLMRRYQDAVAGAVTRYGGHVAKYLGDGVLAYFGWPRAYEDQAERAVRASLDTVSVVAEMDRPDGTALSARVGIATGHVVVGDLIGTITEDTQAVTGETPNLAARLQSVADPGQIVIGATTRRLLGATFDVDALGDQSLKGFDEPVPAWRIIGESAAESRFDASHDGAFGGIVGRDYELGFIRERWNRSVDGHGQVVLLSGEAGFGKSRLVRALSDGVADQRHFRLSYQCSPHHTNSALFPVVHQVVRAAGFEDNDNAEAKLDKLEKLLSSAHDDGAKVAPIFAALLALPYAHRYGELDLDPQQLRAKTIEALIAQIVALSRQRPVLLILEDAHWLDPTTEALVGDLIAGIADAAVLVLITLRPEYQAPWLGHAHLTMVVLNRLDQSHGAEIVRAVARDALAGGMIDNIVARSGGVPLFLEELTKSVVESGSTGIAPDTVTIPETLQASLLARLDRLGDAREITQIGAVIGHEFSYRLIAAVAGKTAVAIDAALATLVDSELAFQRGEPPEADYTFKHALIQDAAYDSLLISRRKELHGRVVAAVERMYQAHLDDHVEYLAYHTQQGELWDKALTYCRLAGLRANERSSYREALRFMDAGLSAANQLGDDRETIKQVIEIYMNLRPSLGSFGQYERLLTALSDAHRLARSIGDKAIATFANIVKTHVLYQSGQVKQGLEVGESAVELARSFGDQRILVAATANLAMGYCFHGDFRSAVDSASECVEDLKTTYRHENLGTTGTSSVNWLSNLSGMHSNLGEFDYAKAWCAEARTIAAETGKPFDRVMAAQWYGHYLLTTGRIMEAIEVLEATKDDIEENSIDFLRVWLDSFRGEAYTLSGELDRAQAVLSSASELADRIGLRLSNLWSLVRLSTVYLDKGDLRTGTDYAERAFDFSKKSNSQWFEQLSLQRLARAEGFAGAESVANAEGTWRRAIALAEKLQMLPDLAHSRRGLGELYGRDNRPEDAARELSAAAGLYRSMGMAFWLPQTEALLDEVGGDRA